MPTALKTSDIRLHRCRAMHKQLRKQLNNETFALLSTRFSYFKIDYLFKRIGMSELSPSHLMYWG